MVLISVILEKVFAYNSRKILFLNVIFSIMVLSIIVFLLHTDTKVDNVILPIELDKEKTEASLQIFEAMLFNNSYRVNALTHFIKELITLLAIFSILNSYEYIKDEKNLIKYEFMHLILFATLSLYIIVSANDFIVSLWV
jgi:NADH:ubiquinone oxidoreductase subunit 2 (subunit N)